MGTNPEICLNGISSGNWVRDTKKSPEMDDYKCFEWSGRWDSNPQQPAWKAGALAN